MSLKAMSLAGRQSKRQVVRVSQRCFEARAPYETLPPVMEKPGFDMSNLQPQRDLADRCHFENGTFARRDNLYHHYFQEVGWKQDKLCWSGYYGPYWTAHFGMHHHYLKRRLPQTGVYDNPNPLMNMYQRFCDNRGIDWSFPNGQNHHMVFRWVFMVWVWLQLNTICGYIGEHWSNKNPEEKIVKNLPPYGSAFYQYILAGVDTTPGDY